MAILNDCEQAVQGDTLGIDTQRDGFTCVSPIKKSRSAILPKNVSEILVLAGVLTDSCAIRALLLLD